MPWEKQFDVEQTLEKAMNLFWQQGYGSTSMQSLVKHMGVNPGSMYATYGNKRELFIKAFLRYQAMFDKWFEKLEKTEEPVEGILAIFDFIIDDAVSNPEYAGCLLVNTALEVAPYDIEISELVERGFCKTRLFFKRSIERGQASGSIPTGLDAEEISQLLFGMVLAMRVISRGSPASTALSAMRNHARELLH